MYLLWGKPAQYGGIGWLGQNPTADEQCPIFIISPLSSFPIFILLPLCVSLISIFENRAEEECDVQLHLSARGGGCHHQRSEQVQMMMVMMVIVMMIMMMGRRRSPPTIWTGANVNYHRKQHSHYISILFLAIFIIITDIMIIIAIIIIILIYYPSLYSLSPHMSSSSSSS